MSSATRDRTIALIRTGTANLASVLAAFRRLGHAPLVTTDPQRVAEAAIAILPGVGAFGASMGEVQAAGLGEVLRERAAADRPLMGVCVGLQLLCGSSEEGPGVPGLGVIPGHVARFPEQPGLRVPNMGWCAVTPTAGARWLQPGHAYFAHSYRLTSVPEGWEGAVAEHGGPFVAALERGRTLALQLHPELSGAWGEDLLRRWLEEV